MLKNESENLCGLKNMSNWAQRLKSKMKELNLTQEALAKKLGVTRSAVAHYVQGTRHPPVGQIIKLAAILKADPAWLQFGKLSKSEDVKQFNQKQSKRIPVVNWQQVSTFHFDEQVEQYLDYFDYHSTNYFALQIKSDAMVSPLGQSISFNQDNFIIVNPAEDFSHRSFVIAVTNNKKEAIFRQYVEEGGQAYLKPLNPQYPLIPFDKHTKIIGVVLAVITLLK